MNAERKRKGKRRMRRVLEVLRDAKNALLGAGALAGAIVAIFSAVSTFLPKGSKPRPQPTAIEASIEEADVEPGVLLTKYEYISQPAALGNASEDPPPQRGAERLAVFVTSSAQTSSTATTEVQSAGSSPTTTSGGETIKEEPKPKEEPSAAEAAKAREELQVAEEEAAKAKAAEEIKAREEAVVKAAAKVRAAEEARLRKKEATKIKREEQEEATAKKVKPAGGGHSTRSDGAGGEVSSAPAFAKPPASPTPLHREGNAKVLVGTGAPTSQVDAVLAKVKALLRKERTGLRLNADLGDSEAPFSAEDPVFTGTATSELVGASSFGLESAAKIVPSHCDTACGLRPTIDKAIADNSSNLAEAAREIAAAFTESRVQVFEHKPQPIGVIVYYKVHFVGFAGKRMILEWTLCSKSTGRPLPRTWWRNVIVKQFVPKSDGYRTSGNFWAPVPPEPGNYYFRLGVFEGSTEPTHKETGLFH
jgi:hypothetical protein